MDAVAVEDGVDDVGGELGRVVAVAVEADAVVVPGVGPGAFPQRGGRHPVGGYLEPRGPDGDA